MGDGAVHGVTGAAAAKIRLGDLPKQRRYRFSSDGKTRFTHHLFRFPAKFHPPVVRQLLKDYTAPGELVLDPFCGSGTLMVEASVMGRHSVGIDVDPLSAFVSRVKVHPLRRSGLELSAAQLQERLKKIQRTENELGEFQTKDLSDHEFEMQLEGCPVPEIPKLSHWFYRYATADLARLLRAIDDIEAPGTHRDFFRLIFASTIRGASRADPVPVSGVEVTKVMLEKEKAGRSVDVVGLFSKKLQRGLEDMQSYYEACDLGSTARVYRGDVAALRANIAPVVDAVITSPPYHGAVDYYRRHQLEMFWLGITATQAERLEILEHYLGRPRVPARHAYVTGQGLGLANTDAFEKRMRKVSNERANAFKHYAVGMSHAFEAIAARLRPGGQCIFVVGHSSWNGASINTSQLMAELARPHFRISERLWYPVKNRYMSYSRHNGANIDREHVLVFERCQTDVK